jgi:hypothetical protein
MNYRGEGRNLHWHPTAKQILLGVIGVPVGCMTVLLVLFFSLVLVGKYNHRHSLIARIDRLKPDDDYATVMSAIPPEQVVTAWADCSPEDVHGGIKWANQDSRTGVVSRVVLKKEALIFTGMDDENAELFFNVHSNLVGVYYVRWDTSWSARHWPQ